MPQFQELAPGCLLGSLFCLSQVALEFPWAALRQLLEASWALCHLHRTCVLLGTRISSFCQLAVVVYKRVYFPGAFQLGWAESGSQGVNEHSSSSKQMQFELKDGDLRGLEPRTAPRQRRVNAKTPNPGAPICQPLLLSQRWEGWLSTSISLNLFLQSLRTRSSKHYGYK